ncbi:hypothetical protein IVA82_40465, partial [Bradyrhizobium sp. 142]|nr:hypothetical protein [Bradyrhizobium sp. 142]
LLASDEVVVEATANSMAVSRVLAPFVARVIIAKQRRGRQEWLFVRTEP